MKMSTRVRMLTAIVTVGLGFGALTAAAGPAGAIEGGVKASAGQAPWAVTVGARNSDVGEYALCSGAVIADHWVLTAGHCAYMSETPGDNDRFQQFAVDVDGHAFSAEPYLLSPTEQPGLLNDVMLLYLPSVRLSAYVSAPLPLAPNPTVAAAMAGRPVSFYGSGITTPDGQDFGTLLRIPTGSYIGTPASVCPQPLICFDKTKAYATDGVTVLQGDSGAAWVAWYAGQWLELAPLRGDAKTHAFAFGDSVADPVIRQWITNTMSAVASTNGRRDGTLISEAAGSILRTPTGSSWIVSGDGFRTLVPTSAIFQCLVAAGHPVVRLSTFDTAATPTDAGARATCTPHKS